MITKTIHVLTWLSNPRWSTNNSKSGILCYTLVDPICRTTDILNSQVTITSGDVI